MDPAPVPAAAAGRVDDATRTEAAVQLADRLLRAAAADMTAAERRRQHRLGRVVADPAGRDLVQALTDEILRLDHDATAARRFAALVADGVPPSLGRLDRWSMRAGALAARVLPAVVMPLVRRRILAETRGLVIRTDGAELSRYLQRRRREGTDVNINVLGEAILSDEEAEQRIRRVIATIERTDVDYVSVKISALCALLDVYAFEHSVERIRGALRRVFDAAARSAPPVFVNLDMEEYADLQLTIEAFVTLLDEPAYRRLPAGIVLQAYLPDSHAAMDRLGAWAVARVAAGGAPIKVRIVKGANLAMELVEAEQHGWVPAPYPTKADTDASYKRLLDSALRPEWAAAVRVGVASHNLFELAWALGMRAALPAERQGAIDIEMLQGMVPAQTRAVHAEAGTMLLYCPVVRLDEIEASLAYLARRLDENTSPENFLRSMFTMEPDSAEFAEQAARFRTAVAQRRRVSVEPRRPGAAPVVGDGFANTADSDLTAAATRGAIAVAIAAATDGDPDGPFPTTEGVDAVDHVMVLAVDAGRRWAAEPTGRRAALLRAAAEQMTAERATTLAVMADEAGKTVREGDPEVSEAIDFARYYATATLDATADPVGVVVVASPWNFPYAIPAGGVFGALMAGNSVVLKPPAEARRTAWLLANQCWRAGIPDDVLQYAACPDDDAGRRLITHRDAGTVVLTGSYDTAQLFLDWRPDLRLLAETSGKNAIVVTEAADVDAAIRDLVRSAFGHAGQKCSAASLAILTAAVYDDPVFVTRLAAAVRSLRVGPAHEPSTIVGPLIDAPGDTLRRALTTLDGAERWLVEPRCLDGDRLWTPGVRTGVAPGSWFHVTECFGPVLGLMRADDLAHAVALQNATPYGLTGGIQSLDDSEIDWWLEHVAVGNAYVNRHITGAIVRRQPFGGWKRSSVGGAPKAGGPHYVDAFRRPPSLPVDAVAAAAGYAAAWREAFAPDADPSGLRSESNVVRHRPLGLVVVRRGEGTPPGAVDAAIAAAGVTGTPVTVSDSGSEPDDLLAARLGRLGASRMRLLTTAGDQLLRAAHHAGVTVDPTPVSPDAHFEMPHWVLEQAISRTLHRYGLIGGRARS